MVASTVGLVPKKKTNCVTSRKRATKVTKQAFQWDVLLFIWIFFGLCALFVLARFNYIETIVKTIRRFHSQLNIQAMAWNFQILFHLNAFVWKNKSFTLPNYITTDAKNEYFILLYLISVEAFTQKHYYCIYISTTLLHILEILSYRRKNIFKRMIRRKNTIFLLLFSIKLKIPSFNSIITIYSVHTYLMPSVPFF